MIETLNIHCSNCEKDFTTNEFTSIYSFFTSYRCPVCHKSILDSMETHAIKYSATPTWNHIKVRSKPFEDLFANQDKNSRDELINGLKSGEVEYQKLVHKFLKCNKNICINFTSFSRSQINEEGNMIIVCERNSLVLYHEIGHAIYKQNRFLFGDLKDVMIRECIAKTKKQIYKDFNKEFHLDNVKTPSEIDGFDITKIVTQYEQGIGIEKLENPHAILYYYLYRFLGNHYAHFIDVANSIIVKSSPNIYVIIPLFNHQESYYKDNNDIKLNELFANLFCIYAIDDKECIKLFGKYFPKCTKEYKRVITKLKTTIVNDY